MIKRLKNRIKKLTKKERAFIIVLLAFSMVFLALSIYLYINDKNNAQNELNNAQNQEILNTSYYTLDGDGNVIDTWNQLAYYTSSQIPTDNNGITYRYTDGTSILLNGTATAEEARSGWTGLNETQSFANRENHKMLVTSNLISGLINGTFDWYILGSGYKNFGDYAFFQLPSTLSQASRLYFRITNGTTLTNVYVRWMCIDLTSMYGIGNEPTTYAQFISDNPRFNEYVAYTNGHNTSVIYYSSDNYDDYGFNRFNDGITYADGRVNTDSVSYTTGYDSGYTEGTSDANNTIVIGSASYNAGIEYADGRVNTDSASYGAGHLVGYNEGIEYADGRVNTDSASYTTGYDNGITYADGRVNTDSASYEEGRDVGNYEGYNEGHADGMSEGYADGFNEGINRGYINNPFYNAQLSCYLALSNTNPSYTGTINDTYLQGNTYLKPYEFFQSIYSSEDLRAYVEDTRLGYFKLTFNKSYPLSSLILNVQTTLANDFNYTFTLYFDDNTSYIYNNPQTSEIYRSFNLDLTQIEGIQDKNVSSITWRRQGSYEVNVLSLDGYFTGYADGSSEGYKNGYDNGYSEGYEKGETYGYDSGYIVGVNVGQQSDLTTNGMKTLFNSILSYPVNMLQSVFNFEFMGINVASVITFIISIGIVAFIIKKFLK